MTESDAEALLIFPGAGPHLTLPINEVVPDLSVTPVGRCWMRFQAGLRQTAWPIRSQDSSARGMLRLRAWVRKCFRVDGTDPRKRGRLSLGHFAIAAAP